MARKRRTVADRIRDEERKRALRGIGDNNPPEPIEPPPLLPFERPWGKPELAAFLGMTESGLDKLIKEGRAPPHFHAGRMLRWRPDVVRRWVAEQEELAAEVAARLRQEATAP